MSRADDLQAALATRYSWPNRATLLAAIPDLLAVVRTTAPFVRSFIDWAENEAPADWDGGSLGYDVGGLHRMAQEARAALAAFEEGGR